MRQPTTLVNQVRKIYNKTYRVLDNKERNTYAWKGSVKIKNIKQEVLDLIQSYEDTLEELQELEKDYCAEFIQNNPRPKRQKKIIYEPLKLHSR